MIPKFEEYQEGFGAELICPSCGSNNLHHDRVEIYERNEDAVHGLHVVVVEGKATLDNSLEGNPSSRRHGLKIFFWCEGCKAKPVLSVKQHKGTTYADFE